jgi:hypothetical protein
MAAGLALISAAAFAQSGVGAMLGTYDNSKTLTQTGVITDLTWANPHCVLFIDVKGADGKVVNWAIELSNPRTMIAWGATPAVLAAGKEITVILSPSTTEANHGLVRLLKSGDKEVFNAFKDPVNLYAKQAPAKK